MGHSSELWFHPQGAGAPAHMDPHCSTTVSLCFSGTRRWRMMVPPDYPHPHGYFDGEVYGARDPSRRGEWRPTFVMEAPAGSAVVVYPGMVHETLSTGEECSSSISQTFSAPIPAAYYRAFWPRFALIHEDVGQCSYVVEDMVVLGSSQRVPTGSQAAADKAARRFAAGVDKDGDGKVSPVEMAATNQRSRRSEDEMLSFHDVDGDGVLRTEEVVESWLMYASAMARLRDEQAKRPRDEM